MKDISEVTEKIPTMADVLLNTYSKNSELFVLKDAMSGLQLAWYWLNRASKQHVEATEEVISVEQPINFLRYGNVKPPTLLNTMEQLTYLKEQLTTVTSDLREYQITISKPYHVEYDINQGYNKLVDALFNIETSILFYNEMLKQKQHGN